MSIANDNRLKTALDSLTSAMSSPVLAGELVNWFDSAIDAMSEMEKALAEAIENEHPPIFAQIAAEDQEMLAIVERLEKEDQELLAQIRQLKSDAEHYRKAAEKLEPKETFLQEPLKTLHDQWLELFGRVNKQESGIATSLHEALQRDRGAVD